MSGINKGRLAKGPTTQEFCDFIMEVHEALKHDHHPIYIFDNTNIHNRNKLKAAGIGDEALRLQFPPYSSEFNQVAEHVHAIMVNALQKAMNADPDSDWTPAQCMAKLEETFYSIPAESLKKDVRDLKATCLKIIRAGGGYPEAHW